MGQAAAFRHRDMDTAAGIEPGMVGRADAVQRDPRKSAVMATGHAGAAGHAGAHGDADGGAGAHGDDTRGRTAMLPAGRPGMVGRADAVQRKRHAVVYGEARAAQVGSLTGSVLDASSSALYNLIA